MKKNRIENRHTDLRGSRAGSLRRRGLKSLAVAACMAALVFSMTGCKSGQEDAEETAETEATEVESSLTVEEETGLQFPYAIDDGKLTVNSVFSSDIDNPDGDNETVEGLISVEVENTSGEFLVSADLTVTLEDGSTVPVSITDLPAGEKVWAFATDNSSAGSDSAEIATEDITADQTEYSDAAAIPENLEISVEETTITLTNTGSDDMTNLNVACHTKFDDVLFGGITYTYTVDSLAAGDTATVDAEDCWLGEAEVVSISQ